MTNKNLKIEILNIDIAGNGHVTNCYIVYDNITKETIIIDPGYDANKIIKRIEKHKLKPKYAVFTHCHGDHIGAIDELKYKYDDMDIAINKNDVEGYLNPNINYTQALGLNQPKEMITVKLDDNDKIYIGDIEFEIIHTPGHTVGGMCLYNKENDILFSGDTLFANTYGRTDLATANHEEMKKSLKRLFDLPGGTIIYSGHGKIEKIEYSKPRVNLLLKIKKY